MDDRRVHSARRRTGPLVIAICVIVVLIFGRLFASTLLDFEWWKEVHQLDTWINLLLYGVLPIALAAILLFAAFIVAWRRGLARGSVYHRADNPLALRLALLGLLVLAVIAANATIDSWTVVRFFGGMRIPAGKASYIDPIFGKSLRFYFFQLPFYNVLLRVLLTGTLLSLVIYWISAHFHDLMDRLSHPPAGGGIDFQGLSFGGAFDSRFIRIGAAVLLVALAFEFYFSRYDFLFEDHGAYLLGVDYVADHIALPLQWLMIVAAIVAAVLVLVRRAKLALLLLLVLPVRYFIPGLVGSLYVRPNELALQRPYIAHHIEATRSAYGLNSNVKETTLDAKAEIPIDYAKHKPLLDNVRLWDWKAFHDTVSQIQPLRPYTYLDSDIDRYQIDGALRQVLLTPRELDIPQLGDAARRWINPHLIYTHGYGIVMAEANRITADGLPMLFVRDAPPEVTTPSLKFTRPQLYYSEADQEPVFVATSQPEFDYPSGEENVHTRYTGSGGFPISPLVRVAAAVSYADPNILLTDYFTSSSRMMIHRRILERLSTMAGFLNWDQDPYLVLTKDGHLVWIADGYMTSSAHPYSRELNVGGMGTVNYMRNSVKATVDAYTGETHLYVFDPADPLIQAYWQLFPHLLQPESAMPPDIRAHARYPETLFSVQAEIYRAFHMRDPEAFYNRADLWDIATTSTATGGVTAAVKPTYVVATMPGEDTPEFLLLMPFTPANKDNLIGMMLARCDGPNLGQLVFQQLGKQNIVYGPKQIESFINQDQTIAKDLTLWNQQSSEVLRGQILVLPIDNSFLYVEPIYIQASGARMPQLKKVALAMGNRLAYANTYDEALALLIAQTGGQPGPLQLPGEQQVTGQPGTTPNQAAPAAIAAVVQTAQQNQERLRQLHDHFDRYRQLNSQGKFAEAGKELEAIQQLLKQ
jgi:hypothetical protein